MLIAAFLLFMNSVAFLAFVWDRWSAARRGQRIPERMLLGYAALGGVLGAFAAQQLFRHKVTKEPFRSWLWMILGVQSIILVLGYLWLR